MECSLVLPGLLPTGLCANRVVGLGQFGHGTYSGSAGHARKRRPEPENPHKLVRMIGGSVLRRSHLAMFAAFAGISLSMSGCGTSNAGIPVVLRVAKTVGVEEIVDSEDYEELQLKIQNVIEEFRDFDSDIRIKLALYDNEKFVNQIRNQTWAGFGPDLIITDSNTTHSLHEKGLIDTFELTDQQREGTPDHLYQLVTNRQGELLGRPVAQYIQIACYNKDKIKKPPTSKQEFKEEIHENSTFGMSLNLKDIFWTTELYGAEQPMVSAMRGITPDAQSKEKITNWLRWLEQMSYQQNIRFMNNQQTLRLAFLAGNLDWITCWSSSLPELRRKLKDKLGTSPLPKSTKNDDFQSITKLQVWSLGVNSSKAQREKAIGLIDFITKPWAQKTYVLENRNTFPVNTNAAKIVASKIVGGERALAHFERQDESDELQHSFTNSAAFRDPTRYKVITNALQRTIYDIKTPKEATDIIVQAMMEEKL